MIVLILYKFFWVEIFKKIFKILNNNLKVKFLDLYLIVYGYNVMIIEILI